MTTSPHPAMLAGPSFPSLPPELDRLLPLLLHRSVGDVRIGSVAAARRAVRRRVVRLTHRRRVRRSLGSSTLAAGLVAAGAHQLWARASSGVVVAAAGPATPDAPAVPIVPPAPPAPPAPPGPAPLPDRPSTSWTWDAAAASDRVAADPGLLYADGAWHVYSTTATHCVDGACVPYRVPRFTAAGLDEPGRLAGDAMPALPGWVAPDRQEIWAPAVARVGDRYVMWFTATTGIDGRTKCIGAAVADRPDGPFLPLPAPLRCTPGWWAIDPYPVQDGDRWYLLWREDDAAHPTGRIVAAELTADGLSLAPGEPVTLLAGEHGWEDGTPGPAIGPIENPALARHPGTGEWLLAWSANSWTRQDYATGLASCAGPLGPCQRIDGPGTDAGAGEPAPWLRTEADLAPAPAPGGPSAPFGGAGGLAFAAGPDGRLYAVFHAYPGRGEHPDAVRAGWVARVDVDPSLPAGDPDRYRLVPVVGNLSGDPSVNGT